MPATWLCPSCGRRVPASLGECRCGSPRPSVQALERATSSRQKLPRDVLALAIVLGLVVIGGIVALFLPYGRGRALNLLGVLDRRPPQVTPTPTPRPASTPTPVPDAEPSPAAN